MSVSTDEAMRSRPRWLIYRGKVPYYVNGQPRSGELDGPDDVAQLASFEAAEAAALRSGCGLGFALGPDGDGYWQGIDLDDVEANGLKALFDVMPGYVEFSPSGNGAHAIGFGERFNALGNDRGIEAYCERRFFTVTRNVARNPPLTSLAPFIAGALAPRRAARAPSASATGSITVPVDLATLGELRSALAAIPADCPYPDWQRIGAALKALGDRGRPLFVDWSYSSPNVVAGEPERKWDQLAADRTGYRAVFAEAQRREWINPLSKRVTNLLPTQTTGDAAWRKGVSAATLMRTEFKPIRYVVPGYIAEGLTLLAGAPKTGKSWAVLQLAIAIANGIQAFDAIDVDQGDVLYLALEDNERRLKKRLTKMGYAPSDRLTIVTQWPDVDNGCATELETWINAVPLPTLIIIDVLNKVRSQSTSRENRYEADYKALSTLHELASRRGVSIIVVHHTRKLEADDPTDLISGTRGLTGAADSFFVLQKGKNAEHATLYGRGRDIQEIEAVMGFDSSNCHWIMRGDAANFAKTSERQEIYELLIEANEPLTPSKVAERLGKGRSNVNRMMLAMIEEGKVRSEGGLYTPVTLVTRSPDIGTELQSD